MSKYTKKLRAYIYDKTQHKVSKYEIEKVYAHTSRYKIGKTTLNKINSKYNQINNQISKSILYSKYRNLNLFLHKVYITLITFLTTISFALQNSYALISSNNATYSYPFTTTKSETQISKTDLENIVSSIASNDFIIINNKFKNIYEYFTQTQFSNTSSATKFLMYFNDLTNIQKTQMDAFIYEMQRSRAALPASIGENAKVAFQNGESWLINKYTYITPNSFALNNPLTRDTLYNKTSRSNILGTFLKDMTLHSPIQQTEQTRLLNSIKNQNTFSQLSREEKMTTHFLNSKTANNEEIYIAISAPQTTGLVASSSSEAMISITSRAILDRILYESSSDANESNHKLPIPWIRLTFGKGHYNETLGLGGVIPKHKSSTIGGSFGTDFNVTDSLLLGLAYSRFGINNKFNFFTPPNKQSYLIRSSMKSNIVSAYGSYKITDRAILSCDASHAFTNVNFKLENPNYPNDKTSSKMRPWNTSVLLHYNTPIKKIRLTPVIGLNYSHNKVPKLTIGPIDSLIGSSDLLYGQVGVNISFQDLINADNFILMPSLHMYLKQQIGNNQKKYQYKFSFIDNYFEGTATNGYSTGFNVGGSVSSVILNKAECSLDYNFIGRSKYQEHQGFVQLKFFI